MVPKCNIATVSTKTRPLFFICSQINTWVDQKLPSCCFAIKSCVKLHGLGWIVSTVEDKQLVHLVKSQSQRQLGQSNKRPRKADCMPSSASAGVSALSGLTKHNLGATGRIDELSRDLAGAGPGWRMRGWSFRDILSRHQSFSLSCSEVTAGLDINQGTVAQFVQ